MKKSSCATNKNSNKSDFLSFKQISLFILLAMAVQQLQAAPPSSTSQIGDVVTNPVSNQIETVSAVFKDFGDQHVVSVLTTNNNYIFVPVNVNQILHSKSGEYYRVENVTLDAQNEMTQYTIIEVVLNAQSQYVPKSGSTNNTVNTVVAAPLNGAGVPATSFSSANLPVSGPIKIINHGANGGNGHAGGGIWIFSYPASGGGNGSAGASTNITVGSTYPLISTAGTGAAIEVASVGGNGGNGGDFIGVAGSAASGGQSGNGGNVVLVNNSNVSLGSSETDKPGIYVYSQSGKGGNGGRGIIWSSGGSGGGSTSSGTVDATNNGSVTTQATRAYGLYGLSAAGAAGSGGSSWGIVGVGGTGADSGDGKKVTLVNNGQITTGGTDAHGIFAQSIGGTGGSSGDSGGLVSIGGEGGDGGKGGEVSVTNSGSITTTGENARGIFAESIGGGGGTGGYAGGAVAIGGTGGAGNDADKVEVTNTGSISTAGNKATGIFAQSVGGGGGDGGSTGGLVTIGGDGTSGGKGGEVKVTQGGRINTMGEDAYGIFAQSVGGGGGNGGSSNSGSLFAGFAMGGQGGDGGEGGKVTIQLNQYSVPNPLNTSQTILVPSSVSTDKDRSIGIFAQSVGGGGGNGGAAVQATVGLGASVSIAIGGDGGKGGKGGDVTLTGSGNVLTGGQNSTGVLLQSVGGGGGSGGLSVSTAGQAGPAGVGIALSLGGKASVGSDGGVVTTNYQGDISTKGAASAALVAQSIGGGGGNGGTAIAGAASFGVVASGALSVGLGGKGGAGGAGGVVNLTVNSGTVNTEGTQSVGILAQSVGGGGGNGGMSIAGALSGAGGASGAVTVGLGGKGAGGGSAGKVTANVTSDVSTLGSDSGAVIFQSIGGGGGNGGLSVSAAASGGGIAGGSVSVGVGGEGDNAGHGDTVNATYNGDVSTNGINSVGILAQSVGGGGGNGGNSVAANLAGGGAGAAAISVGLGGKAGGGGNGGNNVDFTAVTLNTSGTVTTNKDNSTGVVAQSVGGGGGNGGYSVAATGALAGTGSAAISVGLGGAGGSGGAGKNVSATVDSVVTTHGSNAGGVVAQSVGGGGGNGGFNVSGAVAGAGAGAAGISVGLGGNGAVGGSAGQVTLTTQKGITTTGQNSTGFTAQSLGGGGGNGGFNVSGALSLGGAGAAGISVGLGGKGAGGGTAGKVIATSNGAINTSGDNSTGFLAQSLGGGGGNGGFNVSATAAGGGTGSGAISVGLGGAAGGGNSADTVNATSNASITTTHDRSAGMVAQSIGGGGGNGGFNVSGALGLGGLGTGAISVGLGGTGGSGGNAAKVTATSDGVIKTSGKESIGFLAQSVGGGGGNGGFNVSGTVAGASQGAGAVSVGLGGAGGSGGNAGEVDATVTKSVTTEKDMSSAIVVQSIGGGGGNGAFNVSGSVAGSSVGAGSVGMGIGGTGAGGGYSLLAKSNVNGDVTTSGIQSLGVLVQSLGGGGGNGGFNVSGTIAAGGVGAGGVSVGLGGTAGTGGSSGDGTPNYLAVDSTYHGTLITNGRNSAGIVAQSLGGGGGNGGFDVSGAIGLSTTGSGAAAVSIGGAGGAGGNAGNVINRVSAGSKVTTNGGNPNDADNLTSFYSTGILAQSIGGGGGNGGMSVAGTVALAGTGSGALAVSVGGGAGTAGNAGSVTNTVTADVETKANHADGIFVQSLGGGGGNGGIAIAGSVTAAQSGSGAVGVGVGGSGGNGGLADFADNTVTGDVTTHGNSAKGIVTQSIGGGGGNGGLSISALLNITSNGGAVGVGVGGSGGGGQNGALAKSDITGKVTTSGSDSTGILTQSLGGGGGTGGMNISGVLAISTSNGGGVAVGVGGSGGGGGDGKTVDSKYSGILTTNGGNSAGLVAQSIGGGGGAGGLNISGAIGLSGSYGGAGAVSIGGSGGGGGAGGIVTNVVASGSKITTNSGSVDDTANNTKQFDSIGIIAQSIGGGGGSGGISVAGALGISGSGAGALSVGVGGSGGGGGDAGNVTNTATATVDTYGYKGKGIFVQSLGGGGGNGGIAVAGAISIASSGSGAVGVGVGGSGGSGGKAGEAKNTVTGPVHTRGGSADGIVTQSIGGGGGNGGLSVAGAVSVSLSGPGLSIGVGVGGSGGGGKDGNLALSHILGDVTTEGKDSNGILVQSLGGGGGTGGLNVTGVIAGTASTNGAIGVGVGGSGGGGGNGFTVDSTYSGILSTSGTNSAGLVAQSIGGGGGAGGLNITGAISMSGTKGGAASVSIGGAGGGGGEGGNVTNVIASGSKITTNGNSVNASANNTALFDSIGVLVQSIGGGGGSGGLSVGGAVALTGAGAGSLSVGVGGSGGSGGKAGNATNTMTATVDTYGNKGTGVFVQSLGGGGGNGGIAIAGALSVSNTGAAAIGVGVGGSGGGGGLAGEAKNTVNGPVHTRGASADGIVTQSIGGGGGNGGLSVAGVIDVSLSGSGLGIGIGVGGSGGDGKDGNLALSHILGNVTTEGKESSGILVQSLGGGGGTGGLNVSGVVAATASTNGAIGVGVGGSGGNGGNGFTVDSSYSGTLETKGTNSAGLVAQSIGGGGGAGGLNVTGAISLSGTKGGAAAVSVGGSGGGGGRGGNVANVIASGSKITTLGDSVDASANNIKQFDSIGVLAQSVGGGGGSGGLSVGGAIALTSSGAGSLSIGVGGSGGSGGDAGNVTNTMTATVDTYGTKGAGVFVQSLGGGGGNGGIAVAGNISGTNTGIGGAIGIGVGGSGGSGGKAGEARNTVVGPVHTRGASADGIVTQSIGGGGGNGGLSVAGVVSVSLEGNGGSLGIGVGGSGGGGKDGNLAESTISGDVTTDGDQSTGILVQSLGGGGGIGGLNVTGVFAGTQSKNGSIGIGVGGSGGSGGNGSTVNSSYSGILKTSGTNAAGLVAQSVGGGGGAGGLNVSGAISISGAKSGAAAISVGGSGGGGGNGGNVTNFVAKGSSITTSAGSGSDKADNVRQFDSIGVLAQSVGGGGGGGGIAVGGAITVNSEGAGSLAFGLGGSGGDGGYAGNVYNSVTAPIETYGSRGSGVIAQSLGGGGGTGGLAVAGGISVTKQTSGVIAIGVGGAGGGGGHAGTVTNNLEGTVHTRGSYADGITSASIGGGGGNGGVSVAGSVAVSLEGKGGTLGIGVGGFGGKGGNAGNVYSNINTNERLTSLLPVPFTSDFTPKIAVEGEHATGMIAQSIGGGGGNGGVNVTGGIAVSKGSGGTAGFGLGGFGGDGGKGGQVELRLDSDILIRGTKAQTDTSNANDRTWYEHYSQVATQTKHETFDPSSTGPEDQAWYKTLGDYFPKIWKSLTQDTGVSDPFYSRVNGSDSSAVLAQSIGGGGGNGGLNVTGGIGVSFGKSVTEVSANLGIGGFGGGGGNADQVSVAYNGSARVMDSSAPNSGTVEFWSANGLVAQSIGGGGGNGGIDVAAGLSLTSGGEKGEGINLGIGGYGGAGGDAGSVSLSANLSDSAVSKTIQANGNGRTAILAQSIGGGGGNGGINVSGGISSDSNITLGIGGNGGDAGLGSNVDVNSKATLFSNGNYGQGILAQSIGGGGGNGGMNISGAISYAKRQETPLTIGVGVGGFGGEGAKSGSVKVNHTGNITTVGNSNHGIAAQSIGGGGGNGAFNMTTELLWANTTNKASHDYSIVAGVGGSAGAGADASFASVDAYGKIKTTGDAARGIVAQSIGGGGGLGGVNFNLLIAKGTSTPINFAIGGNGGSGGNAGAVHVSHTAISATDDISTDGVGAHAIEATSFGGGGGDAGMNLNFAGSTSNGGSEEGTNNVPIVFSLGGGGGTAGNGAKVDVANTSDLTTKQDKSNGILAQSIGGGGGNGALNIAENYSGKNKKARSININVGGQPGDGGSAESVSVNQIGKVDTKGVGIMAQSIGGGGGNASMDYSLAQSDGGKLKINVGRVGGTGGTAGNVDVKVSGDVTTAGDDSYGIAGQSIGNGGGNSSAVTVGLTLPADAFKDEKSTAGIEVSVGLQGGKGGKAGNVTIDTLTQKSITTTGKNAFGILAQSIGGGGGNGGSATAAQYKTNSMAVAVGGEGGEGGTSGQVKVNSTSKIDTHAIGILAQSIGGGGGNGGGSKIMALGIPKASDANQGGVRFNVTVGGLGGTGAASDLVEVVNKGSIKTTSAVAGATSEEVESGLHGVLAQSIGGGGGNGGMSYQVLNYKPATKDAEGGSLDSPEDSSVLNFAIGGKGGIGGTSGDVNVKNYGDVSTGSLRSMGIFAQSVGGGGGNGGMAMNLSYQSAGQNSLNFAMGGNGGSGNRAGNVNVINALTDKGERTTIKTTGANSHGILAMSIGGGGGNGAMSTILNAGSQDKDKKFYNLAVSVGGSGGKGGIGGTVNVTNSSTIETTGSKSHGIAALSIGGGGGNGDMSILVNAIKEQDKDAMMNVSIGGQGGDGNVSSDVTVTNTGFITTSGDKSYGIMAQSIGGGGGNGGMAFNVNQTLIDKDTYISKKAPLRTLTNFSMGGLGGDGADSGNVTVNHNGGVIKVLGNNSYGIFAQTVSGAGGTGSYSIGNPLVSAIDYTVTNVLGAKQGSAGNAGEVNINITDNAKIFVGDATHKAEGSSAIFAQRVVGGGGKDNIYLDLSNAAAATHNSTEFNPHDDGMVGAVKGIISMGTNMINYGKNYVKNYVKEGVAIAQKAVFGADTECHTVNSSCSEEQNIVGGGGDSRITYQIDKPTADYAGIKVNTTVNFGSAGVADANAEAMQSERIGQSILEGDNSESSLVQSIGGGGGKTTAATQEVAAPVTQGSPTAQQSLSLATSTSPVPSEPRSIVYAKLGADQSTNAHGGAIDYLYTGDTSVKGDHSIGTLMQSIGGGGGELRSVGMEQLDVSFGGVNGTQGNGGNITLTRNGAVYTDGVAGHGLVLQSIGGGGGAVFSDTAKANVNIHLNTDNAGNGGNINLTQTGNIVIKGERSTGLIVQSLGGGGGLIDDWFTGSAGGAGRSGDVKITLNSSVVAAGSQSVGVLAQSSAHDGQGNINISLAADQLIWGGKNGIGIHVSGGANNHIVNYGSIATEDGLNGTSIFTDGILRAPTASLAPNLSTKAAESAGMTIDNYGSIIGQLNLTTGKNTFINHKQGQFLGGSVINLGGPDNQIINDGDLQPGGANVIQAIQLNGSFTQSQTGTTYADLDVRNQTIDSLNVTGTATLAGSLSLSLLHPEDIRPGQYTKLVFSAAQGVVDQGLRLKTAPSVVINYKLINQQAAQGVEYKVDFAPEQLGKHLSSIGQYFNRVQTAGGGGAGMDSIVSNLVYTPTLDKYSLSLTQMSPEFYAQQQVQLLNSNSLFISRLADCQQLGQSKSAGFYDSCVWVNMEQESSSARQHDDIQNLDRSLNSVSAGFVKYFDTHWGLGMGIAKEESKMNGYEHQWSDEAKTQQLGFSLNHSDDATHYAVSAAYSSSKDMTERSGEVIDKFIATSERETKAVTLAASWSHIYANNIGYIRPQLDVGYTRLKVAKTQEKGAGALNLQLPDYSENHTWVQPEVEFAWDAAKIGEGNLRLKYSLGAQYYVGGKATNIAATFEDSPTDVQPMSMPIELARPNLHNKVGVEYTSESGIVLLLEAKQNRSENTRASGADLQLRIPF